MSTIAMTDSATMLRRNLRHALRYPGVSIGGVLMPLVLLVGAVYVFGGALENGLGQGVSYIDYVAPGIIMMTAMSGSMGTAIAVCVDMTEGIVDRFRTMSITRAAMLTGHVVAGLLQNLVAIVLLIGVAVAMGFRPTAGFADWLAVIGLLALFALAITWVSVALGLLTKTAEAASNVVLPMQFLPFIGSGFVPTDSMPAGLRWFAENQPFTPIIETVRGLLMGTPIGSSGPIAVGWCLVLALAGYFLARAKFTKTR